jgi:Holliday junction resolvase
MNSREKGKRGERQWRDELRANGYDARRGQQFAGSPDSPDVVCPALPWAHFEVKLTERLDLYAAMEQARRDSGGKAAFVAHRRNYWPWLVTMDAERFYRLLKVDLTGQWAEQMAADSPGTALNGFPWMYYEYWERKKLNIHELVASAKSVEAGAVVVIAHRRPDGRWLITIEAKTFFDFLRGVLPPERKKQTKETEQNTYAY